jgi:hypothetical protein
MSPVEHLRAAFDEAYDRVEALNALIVERRSSGADYRTLLDKLKDAEAKSNDAFAKLRKARWTSAPAS